MGDTRGRYVVFGDLSAARPADLLPSRRRARGGRYRAGSGQGVTDSDDGAPVPVSNDGTLRFGRLYRSSTDPSVRYYLPDYRWHEVGGLHRSSLKWIPGAAEGEPIATLTLELVAVPPAAAQGLAAKYSAREIDHEPALRLDYVLPSADGTGGAAMSLAFDAVERDAEGVRRWIRQLYTKEEFDRLYRVLTDRSYRAKAVVTATAVVGHETFNQIVAGDVDARSQGEALAGKGLLYTHALNHKTLRKVGRAGAPRNSTRVRVEADEDDARGRDALRTVDPAVWAALASRYSGWTPLRGGVDWSALLGAARVLRGVGGTSTGGATGTRTVPDGRDRTVPTGRVDPRTVPTGRVDASAVPTGRARVPAPEPEPAPAADTRVDPALLRRALSRTSSPATRVLAMGVTVPPATPATPAAPAPAARPEERRPSPAPAAATVATVHMPASVATVHVPATAALTAFTQPLALFHRPAAALTTTGRAATGGRAAVVNSSAWRRIDPKVYERAFAMDLKASVDRSDVEVKRAGAARKVVPTRVLQDEQGKPAMLRVEVEAEAGLAATFDPQLNDAMFDTTALEEDDQRHVLIERTLQVAGRSAVFYKDAAFGEQVYWLPQEFRLARVDSPPYAPDLVAAFLDVVAEEADGEVEVLYRVDLAFRVVPWIDPRALEQAEIELAEGDRRPWLTPVAPTDVTVSLDIPRDTDDSGATGRLVVEERGDASVDFATGVVDTLDLSSTEFARIVEALQTSPDGTGLRGAVKGTLLDRGQVKIPLRISLKDTVGPAFDVAFQGRLEGDPAGTYRVALRNHLESPVHIEHVGGSLVAPGVVAAPAALPPSAAVAPAGEAVLTYRVDPPETPVANIAPSVTARVDADLQRLLPVVMVSAGYASDTFAVALRVPDAELYFGPPPEGVEPLVGLRVEFENDLSVDLSADQPAREVLLRVPLLPYLLKEDVGREYRYRVTNLHASGEGARTAWRDDDAEALDIEPAPLEWSE